MNQIAIEKCTALQEEEKAAAESAGKAPGNWALETCTNDIDWEPPYTYAVGKSIAA